MACTDVNLVLLDVTSMQLMPLALAYSLSKAKGLWLALKKVTSDCALLTIAPAYGCPMTEPIHVEKQCIIHLHAAAIN